MKSSFSRIPHSPTLLRADPFPESLLWDAEVAAKAVMTLDPGLARAHLRLLHMGGELPEAH
jgi:hypothetical protein